MELFGDGLRSRKRGAFAGRPGRPQCLRGGEAPWTDVQFGTTTAANAYGGAATESFGSKLAMMCP